MDILEYPTNSSTDADICAGRPVHGAMSNGMASMAPMARPLAGPVGGPLAQQWMGRMSGGSRLA